MATPARRPLASPLSASSNGAPASASVFSPSTSIPIRAIASTLSTRSTRSVPPASAAYEPLVKTLFAGRLKGVLLSCGVVAWAFVNAWRVWQTGRFLSFGTLTSAVFSWRVWLFVAMEWGGVALPALMLHKLFLTDRKTPASSPYTILKSASKQSTTRIALVVYLISAGVALLAHVGMAYSFEYSSLDPKLTVFVKSKKHPRYLNGRLLFLSFVQFVTAFTFVLRGSMIDRFAYQWSNALSFKTPPRFLIFLTSAFVSVIFATTSVVFASILFALCRFTLPILYKIPFVAFFLRPFTAHFLRGSWTLLLPFSGASLGLLIRGWFVAFGTIFVWEVADSVFENIVCETAALSHQTPEPNLTLVSGLTSNNRVFKFFAFSELRDLAASPDASASQQRQNLYGDQKSSLNLWAVVVRESLLLLGEDYQLFLRRGTPAPPPAPIPSSATLAQSTATATGVTNTPLLRKAIFRNNAPSAAVSPGRVALDTFASDGPLAKVVDAAAADVSAGAHVPELFRSVVGAPLVEEVKKDVAKAKAVPAKTKSLPGVVCGLVCGYVPKSVKDLVWGKVGKGLVDWFVKERVDKKVERSLPGKELDVVVVDALANLVCASLTEDRYGMVQRDIPKILEAFVSFLIAVEERRAEVVALLPPAPSPDADPFVVSEEEKKQKAERESLEAEVEKAKLVLGVLGDGLKDGIGSIVRTFGDRLSAFKFPPRIAQKLEVFLEYS